MAVTTVKPAEPQRTQRAERDLRLGRPGPPARCRFGKQALRRLAVRFAAETTIELRTDQEPVYALALEALKHQAWQLTVSSIARRGPRSLRRLYDGT